MTILGVSCLAGFDLRKHGAEASNEIDLSLSVTRKTLHLGEILSIESRITNNASVPVYLEGDSDYAIAIKIAPKEDKDYKRYVPEGPEFSQEAYMDTKINPREAFDRQITVLWNNSPKVSHLNADAAKPETEGRILSDYAFPEVGTYFVKAVSSVMKNGKPVLLESEPIQITVTEPQGEDLEIWSKIKNNGEFAHFLQYGDITRGYKKPEVRAQLQQEVEGILNKYPNSFYAEPLRQSLGRFHANEAKRKEFLQKMQKQKPQ